MSNQDLPPNLSTTDSTPTSDSAPATGSVPLSRNEGGVSISGGHVEVSGDLIGRDRVNIGTLVRLGNLRVFNIDVRFLPVVVILLFIILGLGIYILYPRNPTRMTGEFNVAVAAFSVQDASGKGVNSDDGTKLGNFVYLRLQDTFGKANLEKIHYELWDPKLTGTVSGQDRGEREKAAQVLAEKIGAHILIYGALVQTDKGYELHPEFYVNYRGFTDAAEITGEHDLGTPLLVTLPFAANSSQEIENPALSARATALSLITIGLAYYSIDDYATAANYFNNALMTQGWLDYAGKQVGYILLGNANVRLASKEKTTTPLITAMNAYTSSLAIDDHYARGIVGRANVTYLIALGDPQNPSFDTVDKTALAQSESDFRTALAQSDAPQSANIPGKAHFGIGQIYFVKAILEGATWLDQANQEFQMVIDEFNAGNTSISELAGHSYARQAVIAVIKKQPDAAINAYKQAIKLSSPYWQGEYDAGLGDVYLSSNQPALATNAYQDALHVAESLGDQESAKKYQKKLQAVKPN